MISTMTCEIPNMECVNSQKEDVEADNHVDHQNNFEHPHMFQLHRYSTHVLYVNVQLPNAASQKRKGLMAR